MHLDRRPNDAMAQFIRASELPVHTFASFAAFVLISSCSTLPDIKATRVG